MQPGRVALGTGTLERYKALIPAGRLGEPVDVAEVMRFLASPAAAPGLS